MARVRPGVLIEHSPALGDVTEEAALLPSPVCVSSSVMSPSHRIPLRLPVYADSVYFSLCFIVSSFQDWERQWGFFFQACHWSFHFHFFVTVVISPKCPTLNFSILCGSGSGTAEEEHYRVPGGGEHSHPGCSGADQWLPAQRWDRARELEEPGCQPLQRLLQLQRWSRTLWQGNPGHASAGQRPLTPF